MSKKAFEKFLFYNLLLVAVIVVLATIFGCHAVHHPAPTTAPFNPVRHPFQAAGNSTASIQHGLVVFHVLSIVGGGISAGLFGFGLFSGNTMLERPALIAAGICFGVAAFTLAGIILIPFALWVVGALVVAALGFVGYELYIKFKKPKVVS